MPCCLTYFVKLAKKGRRPENICNSLLTEIHISTITFIGVLCEMGVQLLAALFDCEIVVE